VATHPNSAGSIFVVVVLANPPERQAVKDQQADYENRPD